MGQVYELSPRVPLKDRIVDEFFASLVASKKLDLVERGLTDDRIEKTLNLLFHFLARKNVCYPEDGKEAKCFDPALSVFNWLGPARQVLTREWYRKPSPGIKMIARRALNYLEECGFVFKHLTATNAPRGENVVELFKRSQ